MCKKKDCDDEVTWTERILTKTLTQEINFCSKHFYLFIDRFNEDIERY